MSRKNEFSDHDGDTTFSLERSQDIDFSLFIPCLFCCVGSIFGLHTIFPKRGKHGLHKSCSFHGDCGIRNVYYCVYGLYTDCVTNTSSRGLALAL